MKKRVMAVVVGLFWASLPAQATSIDWYVTTGLGFSNFEGDQQAPGAQGEDRISDANFNLMAGTGVVIGERWILEASYLEQDLLPTINHSFYGVRGSARRYLVGYRQPLTDWLQLGVRAGVIDWKYSLRPLAFSGVSWEEHSGRHPYAGGFLRVGSARGGWMLGYDYSNLDGLEQMHFWTGFEVAFRIWE